MTSGWRGQTERVASVFDALRGRGQSETLGVALLTAIVVILVAVIGVFLFADFTGDDEEQLLANIQGDVTAEEIILNHEGGDSFDPDDIVVLLQGDDVDEDLTLSDENFNETGGSESSFSPGDTWVWEQDDDDEPPFLGELRLFVIHESTNTVLLDQPHEIQVESGGLTFSMDESGVQGAPEEFEDVPSVPTGYTLEATFEGDEDPIDLTRFADVILETDVDEPEMRVNSPDDGSITFGLPPTGNAIVEVTANYDDQQVTDTIEVFDGEPPNYAVEISDTNDPVTVGDQLDVTATIQNTGDFTGNPQEITLSDEDGVLDTTSITIDELTDGEQVGETFSIETDEIDPDEYNITVASEDDADSVDVIISDALTVDNFDAPDEARQGEEIEVSGDLVNDGIDILTQEVTFSVGGTEVDSSPQTLNPGDELSLSYTHTIDSDEPPGSLDVSIATEDATASDTIEILEVADLLVEDINAPSQALQGDTIEVNASLVNEGDVDLEQDIEFFVDDDVEETKENVEVEADSDRKVSFNYDIPDDAEEDISVRIESDDDASDTKLVEVLEVGELNVDNFDAPEEAGQGWEIEVSADIVNTGDVELTQDVEFRVDGSFVDDREITVAGDGTGEGDTSERVTFTYEVSDDHDTDENLTVEIRTDDDEESKDINILEVGELIVEDFDAPDEAVQGDEITATADIVNTGDIELEQDIEFRVDGDVAETEEEFAVDDSREVEFTYEIDEDRTDDLPVEIASDNDAEDADITVLEIGELIIDELDAPEGVAIGGELTVTATIENTGDVELEQDIEFLVDGDVEEIEEEFAVDGDDPREVEFTYNVADDPENDEIEVEIRTEDDDESTTIDILEPYFFVDITGTSVEDGVVTVDYEVENQGDITDEQEVRFLVDGEEKDSWDLELEDGERTGTEQIDYSTNPGDEPEITVRMESDDDYDERNVELDEPAFNIDLESGEPVNLSADQSEFVEIEYTVTNVGDVPADEDNYEIRLLDPDGDTIGAHSLDEHLEPGDAESLEDSFTDSVGEDDLPTAERTVSVVEVEAGDDTISTEDIEIEMRALRITDTTIPSQVHPKKTPSDYRIDADVDNLGDASFEDAELRFKHGFSTQWDTTVSSSTTTTYETPEVDDLYGDTVNNFEIELYDPENGETWDTYDTTKEIVYDIFGDMWIDDPSAVSIDVEDQTTATGSGCLSGDFIMEWQFDWGDAGVEDPFNNAEVLSLFADGSLVPWRSHGDIGFTNDFDRGSFTLSSSYDCIDSSERDMTIQNAFITEYDEDDNVYVSAQVETEGTDEFYSCNWLGEDLIETLSGDTKAVPGGCSTSVLGSVASLDQPLTSGLLP